MMIISKYEEVIKYVVSILFATIGAAITTDSTRIFSIILVPLIIYLLIEFRNYDFSNYLYQKLILFFVVLSNFAVGEDLFTDKYGKAHLIKIWNLCIIFLREW